MADAGKFAWREKYKFEYWRPLTGVREHDMASGPDATVGNDHLDVDADPFWVALGAPETNTNKISFKPPFPAYPSGHATFGAACFQIARRFFGADPKKVDDISFSFVSEELNGVSRDLHQPYNPAIPLDDQPGTSLWHAMFENAVSRVYLGVHWHFDAFAVDEVRDSDSAQPKQGTAEYGTIKYKDPKDMPFPTAKIGGVYLGVTIADDIWDLWQPTAPAVAAPQLSTDFIARELKNLKSSNTSIR
jgi:vanadium chloroperoxidase